MTLKAGDYATWKERIAAVAEELEGLAVAASNRNPGAGACETTAWDDGEACAYEDAAARLRSLLATAASAREDRQ